MSSKSEKKADFLFKAFTVIFLLTANGGMVDVRRCVEALNKLPEMQKTVEQNSKDIREMQDALKRNKIVKNSPGSTDISTAQYHE